MNVGMGSGDVLLPTTWARNGGEECESSRLEESGDIDICELSRRVMLTGVGPAPSTSSLPTTTVTNALPPRELLIVPGIKVDNSQAALSLHS